MYALVDATCRPCFLEDEVRSLYDVHDLVQTARGLILLLSSDGSVPEPCDLAAWSDYDFGEADLDSSKLLSLESEFESFREMCGDEGAFRRIMKKIQVFCVTVALGLLQIEAVRNPINRCLTCFGVEMLRDSRVEYVDKSLRGCTEIFKECGLVTDEQALQCTEVVLDFIHDLRAGVQQEMVSEPNTISYVLRCAAKNDGLRAVVDLLLTACCGNRVYESTADEFIGCVSLEQGRSLRRTMISWLQWREYDSLDSLPLSDVDGCVSIADRVEGLRGATLDDILDDACANFNFELKTQLYALVGLDEVVRSASPEL